MLPPEIPTVQRRRMLDYRMLLLRREIPQSHQECDQASRGSTVTASGGGQIKLKKVNQ